MAFRLFIVGAVTVTLMASSLGCRRDAMEDSAGDNGSSRPSSQSKPRPPQGETGPRQAFVGSKSCRDCHEEFYQLWATSFHGLAMRPYTSDFGAKNLVSHADEITIGKLRYRAETGAQGGRIRERGPKGEKTYPIAHVMGGKNVYYFLTPMERGRLQVLPLAYDVHKKAWYDMAASGVRHFHDRGDESLPWTDRMFRFNTACFNCHVSRLSTRYDLASDAYHTTWGEPGINCELCHGPAGEHVRVFQSASDPKKVRDSKLLPIKDFTTEQKNDLCAACHAKLVPLSLDFRPGDKFFDHFDLLILDQADYYPDGRDLGENYTHTTWMMSPCANSGKLDCLHCHTSSGRLLFQGTQTNKSCLPCHQKYVDDPVSHGHHEAGSKGNDCVACHMPTTRFAGMGRTDHSMRPPVPAATTTFHSPNACNLCHEDKDAAWSDSWVRKWYPRDYQTPIMERASLLDAARKGDWKRLPRILQIIAAPEENAVYRASLVRLVRGCGSEAKWPVLQKALKDASPLVRSSAATALADRLDEDTIAELLAATRDPSRLVRVRAAAALAPVPAAQLSDSTDRESLRRATEEFKKAMTARPDDWAGYANLGTFFMEQQNYPKAVECFETATRLEPRMIGPMVNASLAYSNLGRNDKAESSLRRALAVEPNNAAALFNLGLLLAEEGREHEAENALRAARRSDPSLAAAAYNLGVLCGKARIDEAIQWCRRAHELEPANAKYGHALAFFLREKGERNQAIKILRDLIGRSKHDLDAYLLLGEIYESEGDGKEAVSVYRQAIALPDLPMPIRDQLQEKLNQLARLRKEPKSPANPGS
ncbi:MAG TPA: tetratricopeptide repeat protein [Thermoguttaceae bacterium]|nr:tetratricopeptide repeat protein [Thermoguttaceae bacterium]